LGLEWYDLVSHPLRELGLWSRSYNY